MVIEQDIISLTEFARKTRKHTADLKKHGRPRVLTHNGRASAVVLSVATYEQLLRDAEEHRFDLRLREALNHYTRGQLGTPATRAFQSIRNRAVKRRGGK
jgi:PHD/YefM family antitoxin component YafN of YafNO toxin-antitoxin module